jgi:hypothetical protein
MEELLARRVPRTPGDNIREHLRGIVSNDAQRYGIDLVPCFDGP